MLRKIAPDQVRLGMYIHGFEGSWFRHPFWRTRFLLTEAADLEAARVAAVKAVIVDISKGLAPSDPNLAATVAEHSARVKSKPRRQPEPDYASSHIDEAGSPSEEKARAGRIVARSKRVMKYVYDEARLGRAVRRADIEGVVEEISSSVRRNAHALIGVTRLKTKDEYTYLHSVAVCALMVNFARHLKLDDQTTYELGMAGLLHDLGKVSIPDEIINKPGGLNDEEFAIVRAHPERGAALLMKSEGVPGPALEVCRHHHEKIDGTGYPYGLEGEAISLAARMGAICDVYDALTSNRAYKAAWTPVEAITNMTSLSGHFDRGLLFDFMRSISVFPVGMLVRLRTNRLAVVLDNGMRASRPRVKAFYSTTDRELISPQIVTINDSWRDDQIISEETPEKWGIDDWPMIKDQLLSNDSNSKRPNHQIDN